MKRNLPLIVAISIIIIACSTTTTPPFVPSDAAPASTSTPGAASVEPAASRPTTTPASDFFAENGIALPAPTCSAPTAAQTEGPYYTANTPERNDLLEAATPGTRLIVVGYVLDLNCQPLTNAWLDFWQADANGVYDNAGYTLRGHQFTDAQGRYFLRTVVPGEYPGRTEHIHVKVQPEGGPVLTTQLYFPNVAANNSDGIFDPSLIVHLEERPDFLLAYFNFVLP